MVKVTIPHGSRLKRLVTWPLRMYRTRISAQLIGSSCLVVALTIVLIEVTALTIVILRADPDDDTVISENLGEQSQRAVAEITRTPAASGLQDEAISVSDREALTGALNRLIQTGVPITPDGPLVSLGAMPHAAVVSSRGDVIASTSPEWAIPGSPYTNVDFAPARTVVGRAIELGGGRTSFGNTFVLDYVGETMASAHPIMIDDEFAGVLLLQAEGVVNEHQPSDLWFLARLAGGNVIIFALITVPVLIVAIPIGILRARRISRRLERLSDVATAMARGDLSRRVDIEGEDEVAGVGRRFNDMVTQLERADRSRKAFVSNVSHELRTPVAILQGNLEQLIAKRQRVSNGEGELDAKTLEAMHQETITLARLIDDLFTLARIEEATFEFEAAPVDLADCVRRAVGGIAGLAWEQRRVSVESLIDDGIPPVLGEQARIQQILVNLLYNALRHTPEGGVIVVDAEPLGTEVAVTVSDTGLGIPPDELPHVFDRYRQVERSGRHREGSGLGLAIVKHLVEAMDGRITVESELNQGTTFRFTLPVAMRP